MLNLSPTQPTVNKLRTAHWIGLEYAKRIFNGGLSKYWKWKKRKKVGDVRAEEITNLFFWNKEWLVSGKTVDED